MPMKALHLCNKAGCTSLTRERYCSKHKEEYYTRYNRERTDTKYVAFYKTPEWEVARAMAMARDRYQCVMCRARGVVTRATMVHHIVPVKKDWDKRLDLDNLMSLCESCHNGIKH